MSSLLGRNALVTGASGGIGQSIARAIHGRGASVKLTGRRADVLERLSDELGHGAEALPADLADASELQDLIARIGTVDVLVANAALPASGRLESFDPGEIDRALDVNLRAPVQLARATVPAMLERGAGHLVFVSSMSGKVASAGSAVYSATKFGLRGLAWALREDLRGTGVGVTVVYPSFVRDAGMWAEAGVRLPWGVGERSPGDVARAVVKGIERGGGEIDVAPLSLRAGVWLSTLWPALGAAAQRRMGAVEIAEALARAQRDKR